MLTGRVTSPPKNAIYLFTFLDIIRRRLPDTYIRTFFLGKKLLSGCHCSEHHGEMLHAALTCSSHRYSRCACVRMNQNSPTRCRVSTGWTEFLIHFYSRTCRCSTEGLFKTLLGYKTLTGFFSYATLDHNTSVQPGGTQPAVGLADGLFRHLAPVVLQHWRLSHRHFGERMGRASSWRASPQGRWGSSD